MPVYRIHVVPRIFSESRDHSNVFSLYYCHAREYVHTALRCRAPLRKTKAMHGDELEEDKKRTPIENIYL